MDGPRARLTAGGGRAGLAGRRAAGRGACVGRLRPAGAGGAGPALSPVLPARPTAPKARAPADPNAENVAQTLGPIIEQTIRTTLASVELHDGNGNVVVCRARIGGNFAGLPEVAGALKGQPQTVFRRIGDYHPTYSFEWR